MDVSTFDKDYSLFSKARRFPIVKRESMNVRQSNGMEFFLRPHSLKNRAQSLNGVVGHALLSAQTAFTPDVISGSNQRLHRV